jgi:hypothetical protein
MAYFNTHVYLSQHFHLVFIAPGTTATDALRGPVSLPHILVISRKGPKRNHPAGVTGCTVLIPASSDLRSQGIQIASQMAPKSIQQQTKNSAISSNVVPGFTHEVVGL